MKPLAQRLVEANCLLAPYAVPHGGGVGRVFNELEDETRFPFQRDRDRIIHTQAFRRLKHKTQVFIAGSGDHYRTRLTHTMEVAQLSRDMARTLGLNEDLAECIALAHDLGHPPFAHAGEEELDRCLAPLGLHFEHNDQGLRTVTLLEDHCSAHPGLNLNREVLEGLRKHTTPWDRPQGIARGPTLEAQVVNIADEVAYTAADVDDGLRAGLLTEEILRTSRLFRTATTSAARRGTEVRGALIHLLILAAYGETDRRIADHTVVTLDDVRRADRPLVAFPTDLAEDLQQLHAILLRHFYTSAVIRRPSEEGMRTIRILFDRFLVDPPLQVRALEERTGDPLPRSIADYIAGMTDGFATSTAKDVSRERRATTSRTPMVSHRTRKPGIRVAAGTRGGRRADRR